MHLRSSIINLNWFTRIDSWICKCNSSIASSNKWELFSILFFVISWLSFRLYCIRCWYRKYWYIRFIIIWFSISYISLAIYSSGCLSFSMASDSWRSNWLFNSFRTCCIIWYADGTFTCCLWLEIQANRITNECTLGTFNTEFYGRSNISNTLFSRRWKISSMG